MLINNARVGQGICYSMSVINRDAPDAVSLQSLKGRTDAKEIAWEAARASGAPSLPTRNGAFFLFDDEDLAVDRSARWFQGQQRLLVRARIVVGSTVFRGDAEWLHVDEPEQWPDRARRYWSGEMTETPSPEVLVHGALYFPDWQTDVFNISRYLTPAPTS